jgi:hypothetical protein
MNSFVTVIRKWNLLVDGPVGPGVVVVVVVVVLVMVDEVDGPGVAHVVLTNARIFSFSPSNVGVSNQFTFFTPPEETFARKLASISSVMPRVIIVATSFARFAASRANSLIEE